LRVTSGGDTSRVEQNAIVKANHADGDHARFRSDSVDEIVRTDEAIARRNNFQDDAFARFHGLPGGVLKWKLALAVRISSPGFPSKAVGHSLHSRACAGGQRDLFVFAAN